MTEELKDLRKLILDIAYYGQDANLQSIFSSVEIINVLYSRILDITPQNMNASERDFFVLSKGQSTMGVLAILAKKGFFPIEELKGACQYDSIISMQADRTKVPGIEASAGSLGHGFPIAVGVAWGNKLQKRSNQTYVLVGDGEMNEGTMWEAALFAGSEKLNNLTMIVDDNHSLKEMLDIGSFTQKLETFGFEVENVDGHSEEALFQAFTKVRTEKPRAIVANTIRGYGSKTIMMDNTWFHRAPNKEELKKLKEEVDAFE